MRVRAVSALMIVSVAAGMVACEEDSTSPNLVTYEATLTGAAERPTAVTTNATGTWTGILNTSTNVMTYTLTWSNLSSTSTNAHIHGPTEATGTAAAPVLVDFNTGGRTMTHGVSGTATGTLNFATLTTNNANINGDSLKKLMDVGRVYVNVHSTTNQPGEILGIITRQ